MALIKCPECGKDVSDKAQSCPNCGFPISRVEVEQKPLVGVSVSDSYVFYFNDKTLEIERFGKTIIKDDISNFYISSSTKGSKPAILVKHINSSNMLILEIGNKQKKLEPLLKQTAGINQSTQEFDGVYRYFLGSKQEVYCPRCKSSNCSHYKEQKIVPGKTKTKYTANLNPLKPFTLVNKKEKVIKQERVITEDKFICNSCGKIFN